MKAWIFFLIVSAAFLGASCGQNVESSTIAGNEKPAQTPEPNAAPNKFAAKQIYEEIEILGRFSNLDEDRTVTSLKFQDFQIKKSNVRKTDDSGSPATQIIDADLMKNGRRLKRFEGVYHPFGNEMSFGFYAFLGGTEKQLLIFEESARYRRDRIAALSPEFEVIYDNEDFGVEGGFAVLDIDNDRVLELSASKYSTFDLVFSINVKPELNIIFKYDPSTGKYLPASHIFPDSIPPGSGKQSLDEQMEKFKDEKNKPAPEFFQIFAQLVYAGREAEAWRFFDETEIEFGEVRALGGEFEGKREIREHLQKVLDKDPIYRFIRRELKRRK